MEVDAPKLFAMTAGAQSETLRGPSADASATPLAQAAAVACAYLDQSQQSRQNQAYAVFAELAASTLARSKEGLGTEFSAINLKTGVAPDAMKEPSGWLSPLWARLVKDEPQWQEGLRATARDLGLNHTPKLTKRPGSPALYSLAAEKLPALEAVEPYEPPPAGGVRYIPAEVAAPGAWLGGALRSGVVRWTAGLRWTILGSILLVTFSVLALLWLTVVTGLKVTRPLSWGDLMGVVSLAALVGPLLLVFRFLDELFDLRIVIAPGFMTPISQDNVTLEFRHGADHRDASELAFVRYTATCSQCGGLVVVTSGRAAFPDRLVGRCMRAAREHVYSFDPVTRIGRPLMPT